MIELVDYNEIYGKGIEAKEERTVKKTRRAGGARKKANAELSAVGKQTDSTEKRIKPEEKENEVLEEKADTDNSNEPETAVAEENESLSKPNEPIGIETPEEDAIK